MASSQEPGPDVTHRLAGPMDAARGPVPSTPRPGTPDVPVLAGSFERLAGAMRRLYVPAVYGTPRDGGWIPAGEIVRDAEAFVRARLEESGARSAPDVREVAIDLAGNVSWRAWAAPILLYAAERRVPDLSPDNILLRFRFGTLEEVAFTGEGFLALVDDPRAEEAVRIFEGEDEMRDWMRESLELLLRPLIREARSATRVGERTLWGRASDLAAQRFLWTGELLGDWTWCGREAEAFVKSPGSPLNRNNAFFAVRHGGRHGVFMRRSVCCQDYRSPGGEYCEQCPVLPQRELERRAREVLDGESGVERWS